MKVFAIASIPSNVALEDVRKHLPDEVLATLKLYLEGKAEQFWFRENMGPIFLMNVDTLDDGIRRNRNSSWRIQSRSRPRLTRAVFNALEVGMQRRVRGATATHAADVGGGIARGIVYKRWLAMGRIHTPIRRGACVCAVKIPLIS